VSTLHGDGPPLAAVDLGTNSFHLVVARVVGNNRFEIIEREKVMVRLGSGSGDMKILRPDAVDRAVEALRRFRRIADARGAELRAVATSAVREAENRYEFVRRVREEAGVLVEVVSGAEEARLIHLGVLQAVPVFDRRMLLMDIGGGSTEFVIAEGGEVLDARSLKLGAIRLTERFFPEGLARPADLRECRQYVRSFLAEVRDEVHRYGFEVAVGSSGTIANLAEIALLIRGDQPIRSVGNATFSATDLTAVMEVLAAARTVEERLAIPGLDAKRADIILGGAVVAEQAFAELGITELTVSDFALREGVLLDTIQRRDRSTLGHLRDLRFESVAHLAAVVPGESAHTEHVTELAVELFYATAPWHDLDESAVEFLEAASLLANVGLFISHNKHHLHSAYIIRHSDLLTGFTEREVEIIAEVARYHRKSAPKPTHEGFAALSEEDQQMVRVLAGVLRVATGLDRTRSGVVRGLTVHDADDHLVVDLRARGDAEVELYAANARRQLLEAVLGRPLCVQVQPGASSEPAIEGADAEPGVGRSLIGP
jgi:exopolyphosphatase/guanosine-5'-triphosphate,3'-diphosphate pyrophosphatase